MEAVEFRATKIDGILKAENRYNDEILSGGCVQDVELVENLMRPVSVVGKMEVLCVDAANVNGPQKIRDAAPDVAAEFVEFRLVHEFIVPSGDVCTTQSQYL
jgi:hypothetical protein